MAAPYRDKSILEMSDREREARRQADLTRPGRDAIEGVYPEEFLLPGAVSLTKKLRSIIAAGQERRAITEQAIKNIPTPPETRPHFWKDETNSPTIKMLRKRIEDAALEDSRKKYEEKTKEEAKDAFKNVVRRSLIGTVVGGKGALSSPQDRDEYKMGGKVKSRRGDGIAQRGKTKGRFV